MTRDAKEVYYRYDNYGVLDHYDNYKDLVVVKCCTLWKNIL